MSKGHGATQRKILAWLAGQPRTQWRPLRELATVIYGPDWTRGQLETIRRSAKRLADEGLAEVGLIGARYARTWTRPRPRWWGESDGSWAQYCKRRNMPERRSSEVTLGAVLGIRPLTDAERQR